MSLSHLYEPENINNANSTVYCASINTKSLTRDSNYIIVNTNVARTITGSTLTNATFDVVTSEGTGDAVSWNAGSPTNILINEDGYYSIEASLQFVTLNATVGYVGGDWGWFEATVRHNGSVAYVASVRTNSVLNTNHIFQSIAGSINATAGDIITLELFQANTSGLGISLLSSRMNVNKLF